MKQEILQHIISLGFNVYTCNDTANFCLYERGDKLGMFTLGRCNWEIHSVHKGNLCSGTGFNMADTSETPTKEELELGFGYAPEWAGQYRDSVVKYRNFEEFLKDRAVMQYKKVEKAV